MSPDRPGAFRMTVRSVNGVRHVRLAGEIDLAAAPTLKRRLVDLAGSEVDVDLSGVTFLDASGISAFVAGRKAVTGAGHAFHVRGARGLVRRLFVLMGLGQLLDEQPIGRSPRHPARWTAGALPDQPAPSQWRQAPLLSEDFLADLHAAEWFRSGTEPYLVVDADLRIRAVNHSYVRATGRSRATLIGEQMFVAFPDNPSERDANGVANLGASMETVLSRGVRHWMGVQRYDVPNTHHSGRFTEKVWVPVNSPLMEDGRTVGVLHHVEDVTAYFGTAGGVDVLDRQVHDLHAAARLLHRRFPFAPFEAITGALAHAHTIVTHMVGSPHPEQATRLASLQLEVRFGLRSAHEAN